MRLKATIIFFLAILYGLPTLNYQFTFDDRPHLEEARFNLIQPKLVVTDPTWPGNLYRPVLGSSLMLGYYLHNNNPKLHHATNVAIYAILCLVLFLLLVLIIPPEVAFFGTLIFICSPIHSEVVSSIAFRTELLGAVFGLSAILFAIKNIKNRNYIYQVLSGLLFFLALLSKESSLATIPLLLLCFFSTKVPLRQWVQPMTIFSIACLVYFALRKNAIGHFFGVPGLVSPLDNPLIDFGFFERLPVALCLLGKYIALCLMPIALSFDYSHPKLSSIYEASFPSDLNAESLGYFFLVLALALLPFISKDKSYRFAALWFFLAFGITANIATPIGTIFAERLAFIPSIGTSIILARLCFSPPSRKARYFCLATICLVFSIRYFIEISKWHDDLTLTFSEVNSPTKGARIYAMEGTLLLKVKKYEEAKKYLLKSIELNPYYIESLNELGRVEFALGNKEAAKEMFKKSLNINKKHIPSLIGLGSLYLDEGEIDKAGEEYVKALNNNNYSIDALSGLSLVAAAKGNTEQVEKLEQEIKTLENKLRNK